VKKVWEKLTWSRAFLPPGAPQTNNSVENFNRDFKRDVLLGARPAVFDCTKQLLGKASKLSQEYSTKKFHDTDDNRDYTDIELLEMNEFKRQLELWGDFVFPFWENDANDDDIPDAVVFCRNALCSPIYNQHYPAHGEDTNKAIRPELEKHAKKCYETWKHIDMNDGKLPEDDFKTFDDWKQFRLNFTICRKLPKDDIPKSGIPYDCICTEWRGTLKAPSGYQQRCKCKHAYISALR